MFDQLLKLTLKNDLISSDLVNSIRTFMFNGAVYTNITIVFVSVLVLQTHFIVLICPALHGDFVEGFHTKRTNFDVPAKKYFETKFLRQAKMFSFFSKKLVRSQEAKFRNKTAESKALESTICGI